MTTFLLLVSFILHMITITVLYQLIKQIKAIKQNNNPDTAALMETYLQEIKEENRMLEANLDDTKPKNASEQKWNARKDVEQKDEPIPVPYATDSEIEREDIFETSHQARILQLHDEGISNEEIASQLHCGRREVGLVIKLHSKANNNA